MGMQAAKQLRERLADIRTAGNVLELIAGRPREILVAGHPCYTIDLSEDYRMMLRPNHNEVPKLKSGGVDWSKVTRVKVHKLEVGNG